MEKNMKESLREIPKKNYLILFVLILASLILLFYLYLWFDKFEEGKLNIPILDKYMTVINVNELDNYLVENPDAVLYVSKLNDNTIREFEKEVKKSYKDSLLDRRILYLDITDLTSSELNTLKDKYTLNTLSILNVPCLLNFKSGKLDAIYDVKSNYYDIDKFVIYANGLFYEGDLND